MIDSGDETHRVDERFPGVALAREHAPAFCRQAIEAAAALTRPLDPPALQPASFLEAIQQRIQRCDVKLQVSSGPRLNELADFVAVAGARLDDRQDDQLRRALFQFAFEHARVDRSHSHICYSHWTGGASIWLCG